MIGLAHGLEVGAERKKENRLLTDFLQEQLVGEGGRKTSDFLLCRLNLSNLTMFKSEHR